MYHSTGTALKSLNKEEFKNFLDSFDTVLFDCDGVLWVQEEVIEGSPKTVELLKNLGKNIFYITNNNARPRMAYKIKANSLGYTDVEEEHIICGAYLAALYFKSINFDKKIYVIGSEGLKIELDKLGFRSFGYGPNPTEEHWQNYLTMPLDPEVGAVLVGFDPHISFLKLMQAASYLRNPDILFVATNREELFSTYNHLTIPGTGCLVKTLETCLQREPFVVGKPSSFVGEAIKNHYNVDPSRTLMVGDRTNTDVSLGKRCGFQTLLVLTGSTNAEELECIRNSKKLELVPDLFLPRLGDFASLLE